MKLRISLRLPSTTSEMPMAATNARIVDADMVTEVSNLTPDRNQLQFSVSMQVEANQSAQTVLRLVK